MTTLNSNGELPNSPPTGGLVDGDLSIAQFSFPTTIVISPDDTILLIGDAGNNVIRMIDLVTQRVQSINIGRSITALSFCFSPDVKVLFVSDLQTNSVFAVNMETRFFFNLAVFQGNILEQIDGVTQGLSVKIGLSVENITGACPNFAGTIVSISL